MTIRRKRVFNLLILLAVVILVAIVFMDVVFKAVPMKVEFSYRSERILRDHVQNQQLPVRLNSQVLKSNLLDSFPKIRTENRQKAESTVMKVKDSLKTKKNLKLNEISLNSKEAIQPNQRGDSEKQSASSQGDLSQNISMDKERIRQGESSRHFEESIIRGKHQTVIDNIDIKRGFSDNASYCNLPFSFGKMCPKSYRELGGLCEMNTSGLYCPDIRYKADNPHRQGQLITTRMLRIFDFICKKHNISYWLTGGTLLGAARHKGNIPWDTDNDIDIPLKDYIKFYQIASKDLPSDIFFQNSISDPALRPSNPAEAASLTHKIVGIYRRSWNPRLRDKKSCYKYCIKHGCSWHDGMMIDIFVKENVQGVFPLKQMEFEGFLFPVPKNWRSLLENSYGKNFTKVPEEEQRRMPVDFPDTKHSCQELKREN